MKAFFGLLFAAFAVVPAELDAISVTRGPYLQCGAPTHVTVRWRTDTPTDSRVRFGPNQASLSLAADNAAIVTDHVVVINGLVPGTKYYYSVGTTTAAVAGGDANHYFVTSPPVGAAPPVRIWAIGDAGTATASQRAVRDAFYAVNGSRLIDFWMMLGDNAYNSGTDADYQAGVFDIYPEVLRHSILWSTLGNHDTDQSTVNNDAYPYFSIFSFATAGECGGIASGSKHYYSFDYGNVHVVCLDSMTSDRTAAGAMAIWLQNDLAATSADWIIAFWHHPPYTKGSHDSDSEAALIEMRQVFNPILEAAGVDLVLSGHSHSYERSYLLDGHYGLSNTLTAAMKVNAGDGRDSGGGAYLKPPDLLGRHGAVYSVVGSSGKIGGGALNHPAMCVSLNQLGSLVIEINGNRLDAQFVRETGAIDDSFTILKDLRPAIDDVVYIAGTAAVSFHSVNRVRYQLEWLANLATDSWLPVGSPVDGTGGIVLLTDPAGLGQTKRFYRVRVTP